MLRRSRISVRPNVRPAGRSLPSSQDAPEPTQESPATDPQTSVDPDQTEVKNSDTPPEAEKPSETPREDGEDQNGEASSSGTTSTAGPQRRKRFSAMPNLAKPRAAPTLTRSSSRTARSPVKAVSETPTLPPEDPDAPRQTDTTVPQGLRSPSRRRPSGGGKQPRAQSKPSHLYPSSPASATAPLETEVTEDSCPSQPAPESADQQMTSSQFTKLDKGSLQSDPTLVTSKQPQIKETPPAALEKVQPSLIAKEASEISERAKTLASRAGMSGLSLAPGKSRLSRLLNDPKDLQRLAKARKLRELLKQEMNKERKLKKAKMAMKEYTVDHSKMTMRDLIYYLPDSNPMASYLEEERREMEIVVPPTPPREESPERAQEPEVSEPVTQREEEEEEAVAEGDEGDGDTAQDDEMMVPRVKVAEDGSLIIDEESLTVEVLRAKGPNPADDGDPIFERGSTTTYSSFRKGTYTKHWTTQETDMFFLAISMVGTDFSMIGQLFPHRARTEIKNKFKKEERANAWRIDKAFKEKRRLDLEFFTKLLEKILDIEKKKRKKNKSPNEKTAATKRKRKPKDKKSAKKLSDVEEEEELEEEELEEDDDDVAELDREEVEGEKENEDLSNEGANPSATPKGKRRKKDGDGEESSPDKKKQRKKKSNNNNNNKQTSEQGASSDEAGVPADSEAVSLEDQTSVDGSEKTDCSVKTAKGPVIKPAKLSRGRVPMHIPNVGRRFGQKGPQPFHKPRDGTRKTGEDSTEEGVCKEQVATDESPSKSPKDKKQTADVISSEEEDEPSVAPVKPTRYGRVPKPIQHLNYPAKEDGSPPASASDLPEGPPPSSSSSTKPKPKPKPSARRVKHKPGPALPEKAKLVTLRASQSEEEDDEEEREEAQAEEEHYHSSSPEEENQAPAFVPMSLRSPQPVAFEVEETMEELDISVNVPDVLGISHHVPCPDASCEHALGEAGTVPCEHQLDLLVDVIDFLSPEHMEVSEESYTEAARTLLAIGNLAHLSQSTQDYSSEAHVIIDQEPFYQEQLAQTASQLTDQSQDSTALPDTMNFDPVVLEATQPYEESVTVTDSVPVPQTSDLSTTDLSPTEECSTSQEEKTTGVLAVSQEQPGSEGSELAVPQTRKSHFPKPNPNLERATTSNAQSMTPQPPESSVTQLEPQPTDRTVARTEPPQSAQKDKLPSPSKSAAAPPALAPQSLWSSEEVRGHDGSEEHLSKEREREESVKEVQKSEDEKRAGDSQSGPSDSDQPTKTALQPRRTRICKPKPNLGRATRTTQSKPQPTDDTITQAEPQPTDDTITQAEPQPTDDTITQAEPQPTDDTDMLSEPQTFESTTTQPEPPQSVQNKEQPSLLKTAAAAAALTSASVSLRSSEEVKGHDGSEEKEREESDMVETSDKKLAGDSQSGPSDSDRPTKTALRTRKARICKPKPNLERATRTTQSKPQPTDDTITQAEPQPTDDTITQAEPQPTDDTDLQSEPQTFESTTTQPEPPQSVQNKEQPSPLKTAAAAAALTSASVSLRSSEEVKGHDGSEEKEREESDRAGDSQSGPSDSDQPTKTALQPRRTRICKPKPNLGRATRTTQSKPQPTDDTITQAEPQPTDDTDLQSEPQTFESTTTQAEPPQSVQNKEQPSPLKTAAAAAAAAFTSASVSLRSSEEVKGHDGSEEKEREESDMVETSDEKLAGDSQSGPSDSNQPTKTALRTRKARICKPKPNLERATRTIQSKPQPTDDTITQTEPQPTDDTITQAEPPPTDDTITQAEPQPTDDTDLLSEPQTVESTTTQAEPPQSVQNKEQPSPLKTAAAAAALTSASVSLRSSEEVKGHDGSEEKEREESDMVEKSEEKWAGDSQSGPSDSDQPTKTALQPRRTRICKPNLGRATRTTQSKPQPTDDTITQAEPQPTDDTITQAEPQPTDNTDMQSEPQTFESTTTQPEPPQSVQNKEQPSLLKTAAAAALTSASVSLRSSEEVKGHDGSEEKEREESDRVEKSEDEKRAGDSHSGPSVLDQPAKTTPQTRRMRFPKPKPKLGRVPRASRSQSGQTTTQPEPVANTESLEDSAVQKADISTVTEDSGPQGGADVHIERQLTHNERLSSNRSPPPINITHTFDDASLLYAAPCAEESQNEPIIPQHSEDPALTDPDEPIFILSLTEIPIVPMGEEFGCVSEPFSYTFSTLPSSDSPAAGDSLAVGNDEYSVFPVVPMSVEEEMEGDDGGGGGFPGIKDVEPGSTADTTQSQVGPADPHVSCLSVTEVGTTKPSEHLVTERTMEDLVTERTGQDLVTERTSQDLVTERTSDEEDPPHKKRKLPERSRRAKRQSKPNTAVRKQPSHSGPAKAVWTSTSGPDSPHPESSDTADASGELATEQPHMGIVGRLDPPEATKSTPAGGDEMEASSSEAESQAGHRLTPLETSSALSRRPRGLRSFISDKSNPAPPGGPRGAKAATPRPQVSALRTGRKRPAPAPSTSRTPEPPVAPSTSRTPEPPVAVAMECHDVDPEPSTSQCSTTNKESSAQKVQIPCGDPSSTDEGPLNVSQYFFSDIFTEVNESEG